MTTKRRYGTKELEKDFGPVTFAKLLHTYRFTEELTQNELGKKIGGLSRGIICDYENGRRIPSPAKALDFLSRLASLIPRPRVHLTRFHGVFAPHFKYRSLVTPQPSLSDKISPTEQKKSKQSYSVGWAKILKRVFDIDI